MCKNVCTYSVHSKQYSKTNKSPKCHCCYNVAFWTVFYNSALMNVLLLQSWGKVWRFIWTVTAPLCLQAFLLLFAALLHCSGSVVGKGQACAPSHEVKASSHKNMSRLTHKISKLKIYLTCDLCETWFWNYVFRPNCKLPEICNK